MTTRRSQVLLFVNPWYGVIGPNVGMHQLCLEALDRGHQVHLVVPRVDEVAGELRSLGAVIHVNENVELTPRALSPTKMVRHLGRAARQVRTIARLAKQVGAEAICVNSENMLLQPWSGPMSSRPVVVVVRGARFADLGMAGRFYFFVQRSAGPTYLAVSNVVAGGLRKMGVPQRRIAVVYNGVDLERFSPGPPDPDLRRELRIDAGAFVIGTVGHLVPRKGVHHLIEMVHALRVLVPEVSCLVVAPEHPGHHDYREALIRRVAELGLSDTIRFLGCRSDVPAILRQVDLLFHPSETESFGRAIAEAMACAKPVVGFRVAAVGELIDDGRTGILVEPFDAVAAAEAVARIARDRELATRMGAAARREAENKYDIRTNAAAAIDLLERVGRGPRLAVHADLPG